MLGRRPGRPAISLPWLSVALAVLLTIAIPVHAQPAAGQQPDASASADVNTLIRVLQNDKARAALIARLKQASPALSHAAAAPPESSFVSGIAEYTRTAAEQALKAIEHAGTMTAGIVRVMRGATHMDLTRVWSAVLEVLAVVVVTSLVYGLFRWIGGRIGKSCDRRGVSAGRIRRLFLLIVASLVDVLGVILSWGAGYVFALSVGGIDFGGLLARGDPSRISFSQSLFLNAFLFVELTKLGLRLLAAPFRTHLRIVALDDTTAAYWYFWSSRLTSLLGYSFLFAAPLVADSGSWSGAQCIRILAMFSAAAIVVAIVLQNRDPVRLALTRRLSDGQADTLGRMGAYLGSVWHVLAIGYVLTVLVVWLTNPGAALAFMLRATVQSIVAAGMGMVAVAAISRFISTGMELPRDVRDRLPLLEARLNAFIPAVLRVVRLVVLIFVLAIVAQIWGLLDLLAWLTSGTGREVTGAVIGVALTLLIGGVIYLALASWVEYRINPNFGSVPSARERTLLTLFRNAFTIALFVVVVMLALSQIGVNIAPLLAGAGVIGLAIGFGSQKLVQDVITGIFIQFENAMNVGEIVNAGGVTGLVERLTVRSVSIRDLNGVLHIMPFSSVEKVSNLMRHYSYHVAVIGVAYRENIAEVKDAMRAAFDRLRDTEHGPNIINDLEMHGIIEFGDSAINVRARIRTLPGKHLALGRAYSEIIKEVFDERGIEIAFPHMTVYMGEDKDGNAPPLRLRTESANASRTAPRPRPAPAPPAVAIPDEESVAAEAIGPDVRHADL
jgi:moderate conductance mechanosensitive channel